MSIASVTNRSDNDALNTKKFFWESYGNHYVVRSHENNSIVAHCDSPTECREEIELLTA